MDNTIKAARNGASLVAALGIAIGLIGAGLDSLPILIASACTVALSAAVKLAVRPRLEPTYAHSVKLEPAPVLSHS